MDVDGHAVIRIALAVVGLDMGEGFTAADGFRKLDIESAAAFVCHVDDVTTLAHIGDNRFAAPPAFDFIE